MKKALLIWATAVILVLTGSAAWATPAFTPGSVTFDEGTEDIAVGIISPFPSSGTLNFGPITAESLVVFGTVDAGPFLVPGTRAVLFTGAGDLPVSTSVGIVNLSDYVIATVTPDGKSLTLLFESNGSVDFANHLQEFPAISPTIAANNTSIIGETGDLQGIGGDLIDGTLIPGLNVDELTSVFMRSDLDVVVPLPPSLAFLGSGLLGLVGWRRFRKE
jgi:hypothetical protein